MTTSDKIVSLLENSKFKISDIEFIIKYLEKEAISPELAMRRIKTYDKLQEKLEDNKDKEIIKELQSNINEIEEVNNELQISVDSLLTEKTDLESNNVLLTSEVEQLKEQLNALQEMHQQEILEESSKEDESSELIMNLKKVLSELLKEKEDLKFIINPIITLLDNQESEGKLNKGAVISEFEKYSKNIEDKAVSDYQKKGPASTFTRSPSKKENITKTKRKLEDPTPTEKNEDSLTSPSAIRKKQEEQSKVDDDAIKVLTLFEEFIKEANSDEEFKKSVRAICETDEAYLHLGSIALSQVYSFQSKKLDKKDQLLKLLGTWKKSGVPR